MALTAHDKSIVRRTARELRDAYDRGEDDSLSETVVLSEGYADVHIYPDDRDNVVHVVRAFKRTARVPMSGRLKVAAKHKAGRKTASRKKVPAKRVANPDDIDARTKFTLRRETLNSGGYDRYGEYFGRGAPLFVYEGEVPTSSRDVYGETHRSQRDVRGHVRAADRQEAMAKIRQKYPMARFFGEKRKVANPARKRKPAAKRSWRVVVARDGRSLSVGSHVYEIVNATTRDGAMKAALKRHDSDARIVSLTEVG